MHYQLFQININTGKILTLLTLSSFHRVPCREERDEEVELKKGQVKYRPTEPVAVHLSHVHLIYFTTLQYCITYMRKLMLNATLQSFDRNVYQ